jgi:hypothetical protein
MRTPFRSIQWTLSLGLLGAAAAFALARTAPVPTPVAAGPAQTAPANTPAPPVTAATAAPTVAPTTPTTVTPPAPEETATIHDDPTVAPDSQESADNAVTFPSDI